MNFQRIISGKLLYSILIVVSLDSISQFLKAQTPFAPFDSLYTELIQMLTSQTPINLKKTVFANENIFFDNQLSESDFEKNVMFLVSLVKAKSKSFSATETKEKDIETLKLHSALFKIFADTTKIIDGTDTLAFLPYRYDFDDMFGEKDLSKMFVTKLLGTHTGNCHSMPFLYKIICDELKIPCHLARAPNHIYIKLHSDKLGWYNTELTSASFPTDSWIMASGYVSLDAIQSGLYMDTLSEKQMLTMCAYDLAKVYERKFPESDGNFIIKCCNLAIAHDPKNISALILKAETQKTQFENEVKKRNLKDTDALRKLPEGKLLWAELSKVYSQIYKLGYRVMPEKMYTDWMSSLKKESEKFINKKVMDTSKN